MKKIFAIILLILFLPIISYAESDPVVGTYYMFYDKNVTPELSSSYGDKDISSLVLFFQQDGVIMGFQYDLANGKVDTQYASQGKWEKDGNTYKYSIIGMGSGKLTLVENGIYIGDKDLMIFLHKMFPLNPYEDFIVQ